MIATGGREEFVSAAGIGGRWSLLVGPASTLASRAKAGHSDSVDATPGGDSQSGGDSRYVVSGFSRTDPDVVSGFRRTEIVGFKSYELAIESRNPGELLVTVNGHAVVVTLVSPIVARSRRWRQGGTAGPDGPRRILAPMPGRIVKVLVKPGETVVARQGLVVVEAMKMENELRAPAAGIVRAVCVIEGAAVEANSVLIEIE
jgi:biotin carboxyl carrier protein